LAEKRKVSNFFAEVFLLPKMNVQLNRQTFGCYRNTSSTAGGADKHIKTTVTEKLPAVGEVLSLVYKLGRRNYQTISKVSLKCNLSQVLKLWYNTS
jgi:hypothetical protein